MAAALKLRTHAQAAAQDRERRIRQLEAENARLRREVEKLREAAYFLPAESFRLQYSLLVESAYLSHLPCEVKASLARPGARIPIKDFRAHRQKREVDRWLEWLRGRIFCYLQWGRPIPRFEDYERWRHETYPRVGAVGAQVPPGMPGVRGGEEGAST